MFSRRKCAASLTLLLMSFFAAFFSSCASARQEQPQSEEPDRIETSVIRLVFAGDIMAHANNYNAGRFNRIWQDVTPLIKEGDLAFANIEAPVNDRQEWSTFPQFNMHSDYVQAAVDAGFNVFSLANNHTNDWYLDGINATRSYFAGRNDVWACGLKDKSGGNLTWRLIEKNGWKILFVAFTEILNRPDYSSWIDYYPQKKRAELISSLKELEEEHEHDILVISVHTDEEEYKTDVTENHRAFYKKLIDECKADIIWANHPHVYKEFETVSDPRSRTALIMYANGNTISGQRSSPSLGGKMNARDNTGDGLIIKVELEKRTVFSDGQSYGRQTESSVMLKSVQPSLITSYIQPDGQIVLRIADKDFEHSLYRSGLFAWAEYIKSRRDIYEKLKARCETGLHAGFLSEEYQENNRWQ